MDLNSEFEKLMKEVLDKIKSKKDDGEYDEYIASELSNMIENVLDHGDTSLHGNQCPHGHSDPDCGWSPSMGYHC